MSADNDLLDTPTGAVSSSENREQNDPPAPVPATADKISVEVFDQPAGVLEAWEELEVLAAAPIYQTRRFIVPWLDTMGQSNGLTAMITLVRDGEGLPLALFPFGMRQRAGVRQIEFIGGKDSNTNLGLYRPNIRFSADQMRQILDTAARLSGLEPDLYVLNNQPVSWNAISNPLLQLPHQESPSYCHSTRLKADSEAFRNERLSKDARKKLRSKLRKLKESGPVKFITARKPEEASAILEAFYKQKRQRFDDKNISSGFDSKASREFFARCCISRLSRSDATVELHALQAGDDIVATYGGGIHRGRFFGMFNSFEADRGMARFSPGEILLANLIENKCRQGLSELDLGVGEGRYKQSWCNEAEPLFDTFYPLTARGHLHARVERLKTKVKRFIKQNRTAWNFFQTIRGKLFGREK